MIETSEALAILEEFKRRQEHQVNQYEPSNKEGHNQKSYHESNSKIRLLFGGNQSGKSHAAAFDCAVNARGRNPFNPKRNIEGRDVEIWVIAPEYSLIRSGIYRHLKNIIPDWDLISEGPKIPGHSIPSFLLIRRKDDYKTLIHFLSSKGENRKKFQAAAVDFFYIDEEIPGDIFEELEARTLATGGQFSISATLVESYDWILDLETFAEKEKHKDEPNVFITRLNTELNPYLDSDTVQYLKSKWSQETLEYRFYGKARVLTGLIYNTWDDRKHIIEPFVIPYDWPRWCAIDPGIRTCAALWIAVGPDDRAYGYRELYAHNEPLWNIARTIKELEGYKLDQDLTVALKHYVFKETERSEYLVQRLIDPKARARSEAGEESILSQLYSRFGIPCTPADNSLRPGIEDCRFWLERGNNGGPHIVFFNTLVNFFEERRAYRPRPASRKKDQNEPIEDPIRRKNHLMDGWRYIAREHPEWKDRLLLPIFEDEDHDKFMSVSERLSQKKNKEVFVNEWLGSEW